MCNSQRYFETLLQLYFINFFQVDKIKTVTTKLNSLMQSSRNEMPVLMNDNEETLFWVPELER